MRAFTLTALLGLAAFNFFLGMSGQALARDMHRVVIHDGVQLSVLSEAAFALQPWFYLLAAAGLITAALSFSRKLAEDVQIYFVAGFLVLDIIGLLISLWGFSYVHFML